MTTLWRRSGSAATASRTTSACCNLSQAASVSSTAGACHVGVTLRRHSSDMSGWLRPGPARMWQALAPTTWMRRPMRGYPGAPLLRVQPKALQLIRAVLPHLRAQGGGRILQISSYGGQVAFHLALDDAELVPEDQELQPEVGVRVMSVDDGLWEWRKIEERR